MSRTTFNSFLILHLVIGILTIAPTRSFGFPNLYPSENQGLENIRNNTGSNLVADHADTKKIWVLPSRTAFAKVEGLSEIANMGLCQQVVQASDYASRNLARAEQINQRIADSIPDFEKKQKRAEELRILAETHSRQFHLEQYDLMNERIAAVEAQINEYFEKLNSCTQSCDELRITLSNLRAERTDLHREMKDYRKNNLKAINQYDSLKAAASEAQRVSDQAQDLLLKLGQMMLDARRQMMEIYNELGETYGARGSFTYNSDWQRNIQELRDTNPNYDFEAIPTANAVVRAEFAGAKEFKGAKAVLDFDIGGGAGVGTIQLAAFPDSFRGSVRLSVVGVCAQLYPERFNIPDKNSINSYGLIVAYTFPSVFKKKVSFTFDLHSLYQKTVSSGSSGGLFWTKSWSTVSERTEYQDSFKATWEETDQQSLTPEVEKRKIEAEIRSQLIARVAILSNPSQTQMIAPPALPQNGVVVIADSLAKTCGAVNPYCAGGVVVANVLNAIFGGGRSSASYVNEKFLKATEVWESITPRDVAWTTSYQ